MSEQRKIIHDDNNGLDYVLVGDYYMPMLALPEENRPIGYWGILRKEYLKKHKSKPSLSVWHCDMKLGTAVNGLDYVLVEDYYIPMLENRPIGYCTSERISVAMTI